MQPCPLRPPRPAQVPDGPRTEAALRNNINVCIGYCAAWLSGVGCVPLHNLMEDAATAEISRAQVGDSCACVCACVGGRVVGEVGQPPPRGCLR